MAADPARVGPEHLKHTTDLLVLLRALDDPLVGTSTLESLVGAIPVLAVRCVQRASRLHDMPLGTALARIGNHGLESVLLEVLEDLTIVRADAADAVRSRRPSP